MCAEALYFWICSQAHATFLFLIFLSMERIMHEVQTMYGPCDFPNRKFASPPSAPILLGFWFWWEILLLLRALVYCRLFGFPFLACRLSAFDCFNCTHSYKTLVELHFLNHISCSGQRHVYGVWVFECAYYLVRSLWQWWLNTSCSPVQGFACDSSNLKVLPPCMSWWKQDVGPFSFFLDKIVYWIFHFG